ncbi:MAG: transglycosylase SLT domain-containing protein [Muribaculaceae bacterium]|nr:transglycosylase SLT domain-containing protein [Muribaculaceae bacterium]
MINKTIQMNKRFLNITTALLFTLTAAGNAPTNILSMRDTITDPNIVYPHSFEADTHKMKQNWYLQVYTEMARNDNETSSSVEASDEELIARLRTMPTEIEMPFNSVVKSYISMYVDRRRTLIENMLGLSTYYMPIFEQALEEEGMPLELKYLPIIESALNPNAVSRVGATGLWQFMLPTARGLGMEINSLVDERRDPIQSSKMAARYLKQLYNIYGDWSLAIAAYNCGPGNVNKALRRAGGETEKKDFWEIYPFLPSETRGYVPGFIAANYAMNYYDKHNISPALARRPIITDSVYVKKRVHFQQIADVLNIPIEEIRLLNPQYRKDIIPGDIKAYPLVLPSHQALCYIVSEDSIVAHDAAKYARRDVVEPSTGSTTVSDDGKYIITEEVKFHKVRRGETLSGLAKKYGVTINSIKKANGIKTLRRGTTIKIVTTKRVLKPQEPEEETKEENVNTENVNTEEVVSEETVNETPEQSAITPEEENEVIDNNNEDGEVIDNSESESKDEDVEDVEFIGVTDEEKSDDEEVKDNAVESININKSESDSIAISLPTDTIEVTQDNIVASEVNSRIQSTFNSRKAADEVQTESIVEEEIVKEEVEEKPAPVVEKKVEKKAQPVYHKVRSGETLSKIARRYGTTVKKIQRLNGFKNTKIKAGQRIRVK